MHFGKVIGRLFIKSLYRVLGMREKVGVCVPQQGQSEGQQFVQQRRHQSGSWKM